MKGSPESHHAQQQKTITLEEVKGGVSITVNEFATLFGCSTITVYRKIEAGKMQNIQIGSRRMIPSGYYMKLIEEGGTI